MNRKDAEKLLDQIDDFTFNSPGVARTGIVERVVKENDGRDTEICDAATGVGMRSTG